MRSKFYLLPNGIPELQSYPLLEDVVAYHWNNGVGLSQEQINQWKPRFPEMEQQLLDADLLVADWESFVSNAESPIRLAKNLGLVGDFLDTLA